MNKTFYLLNVCVSGVKSIEEEVRLDFYKKTVDKDFNPEKYRIKAIYGENGSGKSAIITAIKIFQDLIVNKHYLTDSSTQIFLDEIINKKTRTFRFNCEFFVDLKLGKKVYYYSLELVPSETGSFVINHELLKERSGNYANSKYSAVFETKGGELIQIACEDGDKGIIEKKMINLLSTNSFINLFMSNSVKLGQQVNDFMWKIISFIIVVAIFKIYIGEGDQHELYFLRKKLKESNFGDTSQVGEWKEISDTLKNLSGVDEKMIPKQDFNKYKEKIEQLTRFVRMFKRDLVSIDIDAKENGKFYECELNLNYGDFSINKEFESTGIKKIISLFDSFIMASNGGIVFIDEMDSNLNDIYLCKLIEYFMYYGKGQLCFTTHNLDPMTILKENKNSIDFLSNDNHLVPWISRGNATPENSYKNGMIEDSPFNIEASDFIGVFGE